MIVKAYNRVCESLILLLSSIDNPGTDQVVYSLGFIKQAKLFYG